MVFAGVAQLVEQVICNLQVVGSNPASGSMVVGNASMTRATTYLISMVNVCNVNEPLATSGRVGKYQCKATNLLKYGKANRKSKSLQREDAH